MPPITRSCAVHRSSLAFLAKVPAAIGAAALSLAACAPAGEAARSRTVSPAAHLTMAHERSRVGTYVSSNWGFSTSSYWIEGPTGLIVIDTQFLPSATLEMVTWAEAATGKKVELAIVLHANPDKFNGTELLQRRGVKVVTSAQVLALIPEVHAKRMRSFYDRYKPDYPATAAKPSSFGDRDVDLTAGGVTVRAHVLGAGCSEAHVVVEYDGELFAGDLIANDAHSWLEIGKTDAWLERIAEMKRMKPKVVHPGRGPSGTAGLLDAEEKYLRTVIDAVAAERPSMPIPAGALDRVKAKIVAAYPEDDFDVFLDIGLPAEWERQARGAQK